MQYLNLTPAERAATYAALLGVWRIGREPTTETEARRSAVAELVAFHADDADELTALAAAIDELLSGHVEFDRATAIRADELARIVGSDAKARIGAALAGLMPWVNAQGVAFFTDDPTTTTPPQVVSLRGLHWTNRAFADVH